MPPPGPTSIVRCDLLRSSGPRERSAWHGEGTLGMTEPEQIEAAIRVALDLVGELVAVDSAEKSALTNTRRPLERAIDRLHEYAALVAARK